MSVKHNFVYGPGRKVNFVLWGKRRVLTGQIDFEYDATYVCAILLPAAMALGRWTEQDNKFARRVMTVVLRRLPSEFWEGKLGGETIGRSPGTGQILTSE